MLRDHAQGEIAGRVSPRHSLMQRREERDPVDGAAGQGEEHPVCSAAGPPPCDGQRVGRILWIERGHGQRERLPKQPAVVASVVRGNAWWQIRRPCVQEGEEAPAGVCTQHPIERNRQPLDARLERDRARVGLERGASGAHARQGRRLPRHLCGDRRSDVLTLELAELPLPREHPQRVVNPRLEDTIEVDPSRARLEPAPHAERFATGKIARGH